MKKSTLKQLIKEVLDSSSTDKLISQITNGIKSGDPKLIAMLKRYIAEKNYPSNESLKKEITDYILNTEIPEYGKDSGWIYLTEDDIIEFADKFVTMPDIKDKFKEFGEGYDSNPSDPSTFDTFLLNYMNEFAFNEGGLKKLGIKPKRTPQHNY